MVEKLGFPALRPVLQSIRARSVLIGFAVLFLVSALAACGVRSEPVPATAAPSPEPSETPALIVPTPAPSATPTPAPPTATPAIEPDSVRLEPVLTAPAIRLDGWSPDGAWLAYWTSTQEEVLASFYPFPPGRLNLRNVKTGQECLYAGFVASEEGGRVFWQPDGTLEVSTAGERFQGVPCEGELDPAAPSEAPGDEENASGDQGQTALSPSGSYEAETRLNDRSTGILNLTTTILALPDRQVVNSVDWKIDERLGDLDLGGEWLAGNQFLIYETLDQGPLLITVSGEVIEVARQLFAVESLPSLMDTEGVSLRAAGAGVAGTDAYHIALFGVGSESNFPPVRLYHSEDEQVEEMPFRDLWSPAFSSDGRWLLLDEHPIQDGVESHALWVRPVDPPGSQLRFFAAGPIPAAWSRDGSRVAFRLQDSVSVYGFPEGDWQSAWGTGAYEPQSLAWSLDGDALAVLAGMPGVVQQALFIISSE